ncbi:LuxR C-terminal-related transcriptional regulator [Streptomyces sp. Li-HN-5-11]|uniref:response regulator transcription factor n=1 Tax=Streptomyces sp. Li-HN-5-11 TaxID=3075432 RepID=UPI0028A62D3E|nr:LuxR C-terminal-related transcriptional regulator [Streptomyces sp. Li-HN-5-11]WNM31315.1 LuxR C-terminal-related transcriptional regulator [Streptomyces sp. Li-HN-5-11]
MSDERWKSELRGTLEAVTERAAMSGAGLTEAGFQLVLAHVEAAYKRGEMAGRSRTGYRTQLSGVPLTGRHLEIARLAAAGLSNAEIAKQLFLSTNTVKTHMQTALKRTGARSRGHLAALLAVHGQVTTDNVPDPKENSACPAPAPRAGSPSPVSTTAET